MSEQQIIVQTLLKENFCGSNVHVHCSDKYFQSLFSDDLNYFHQSQWKH